MSDMTCEWPGCTADGLVGVQGMWVCLDHVEARLGQLKDAQRAIVTKTKEETHGEARQG